MTKDYTSVEQVFDYELSLIKICGGFGFERPKYFGHLYRILLIVLTKLMSVTFYTRPKVISSFSKSSKQNVELYIIVYNILSLLALSVSYYASTKYYNFYQLLLKKRFSKQYLARRASKIFYARLLLAFNLLSSTLMTRIRNESNIPLRRLDNQSFFKFYNLNQTTESTGPISDFLRTSNVTRLTYESELKWAIFGLHQSSENVVIVLIDFALSSLNTFQTHGTITIVLMIVVTFNDMIESSCIRDGLFLGSKKERAKRQAANAELCAIQNQSGPKPLLTTELLIHMRQLLILIKNIMSFEYLIVYIYDVTRVTFLFGVVFGILKSSGTSKELFTVCLEYVRVGYTMLLSRLAYFWLHRDIERIRRIVDELRVQEEGEENDEGTINNQATKMDETHRIVTYRLAEEISELWPTDWFKPDVGSSLKMTIYVLTFVATLDQLVEAGFEHNSS